MARKRKSGKRTKSGRLARAYKDPDVRDGPTEESKAKRQALVGEGNDPALAECVPGILFARGYLDRDQFAMALEYRRLRCMLYGSPWPNFIPGPTASEDRIERVKIAFDAMVLSLTEEQKRVVTDVTVFNLIPNWFYAASLNLKVLPEDHSERDDLIKALNIMIGRDKNRERRTLGVSRRVLAVEAAREQGLLSVY